MIHSGSHLDGGFVMKRGDEEIVRFNPSIVTVLFVIHKFLDTRLCYLLCNVSRFGRFRKVSRCGVTRRCVLVTADGLAGSSGGNIETEDVVETINDGRTKVGAFESATTMTVAFDESRWADIKIFPSSVHICGLRNLHECLIMLKHVLKYFEGIQTQLNHIYDDENNSQQEMMKEEFFNKYKNNYPTEEMMQQFRTAIDSNHSCCTLPIHVQSKDIVMTNYKGSFNTLINIRLLYSRLNEYPGLICHLSTMSNSNALNIIALEAEPFYPPRHVDELSEEQNFNMRRLKEKYLSMSRRNKAQEHIKHSIFVYSSGKFIQSSRKNESSKDVMQMIVTIIMEEISKDQMVKQQSSIVSLLPTEERDEEEEEQEQDQDDSTV